MLISMAHAAGEVGTAAPAAADTFWMNMGLIGVMFVLFYLLLIRPQQKRLKDSMGHGNFFFNGTFIAASLTQMD